MLKDLSVIDDLYRTNSVENKLDLLLSESNH